MRRVKKACVSSSAIPAWWSTQPSRVTLRLKVKSPMWRVYPSRSYEVGRVCLGRLCVLYIRKNGAMRKRLSAIGNSLGLVIEKPILELLHIDRETELDMS